MTTVPETQTGQTFYRNFILFCLNVIICCTTFRDVIFRGTRHGVHKSWSKHEVTFFQWLPEKMCRIYSVSEKNWFPSRFLKLFSQRLRIFKQKFTCLLYVHIYAKYQKFIHRFQHTVRTKILFKNYQPLVKKFQKTLGG